MEDKYSVVKSYNFDDYVEVVLFPTEKKAGEYVKFQYEKSFNAEKAIEDSDLFSPDDCHCEEDGNWAQLVWRNRFADENDTCTWRVVPISKADWDM